MSSVLLWDRKDDPKLGAQQILCWQSYSAGEGVLSVPSYLEEHAGRIRARYLAFIHDLGEARIAGKRVVDHLDLGGGFSYWWLTQVAEKSPLKSPRIYDCLRLLCLEEILAQGRPKDVTLVSSDAVLAQAISRLCKNLRIAFTFERCPTTARRTAVRAIYDALPSPVQGLLSLRHVMARWPLRRAVPPQWFAGNRSLFLCSYFIHLDPQLGARGEFHSRQWEVLPKFLNERGVRSNWLQLFLFSSFVPKARSGIEWLRRFNAKGRDEERHAFLDSYLTVPRLLTALRTWLCLNIVAWRLRDIQRVFSPLGSSAWLWPLLCADWRSSVTGAIAVNNSVALVLFDAALAELPRQKMGLYLCENQAWEKALLRAWRVHGHGEIVGVQHATAPFWHLYYFDDPRSWASRTGGSLPLPDRLAVNGADAWRAFTAAGFPLERLVKVEALRYLELAGAVRSPSPAGAVRRVLILGDIVPASMQHLLGLVYAAARLGAFGCAFTLKPHPGYAPDLSAFPGLQLTQTTAALAEIASDFDVAIAANGTSAAVDVFIAGLPVIIALDGASLNLSPLRDGPGIRFASSPQQLLGWLQTEIRDRATGGECFFFADRALPRWQQVLSPVLTS